MSSLGRLRCRRGAGALNQGRLAGLIGSPSLIVLQCSAHVKPFLSKVLGSRQGGTLLLASSYVLLGTCLRLGLLVASSADVSWGWPTFAALGIGFLFDLSMAWFLTLPLGLLGAVWPSSWSASRWLRLPLRAAWLFGAFLFTFWKISEILFWEEFGVRFNFIAVDYLVYTTEVVKNIRESYNLPLIIMLVLAVATGLFLAWRRFLCAGCLIGFRLRARSRFCAAYGWHIRLGEFDG